MEKSYICPTHGKFDVECKMSDTELKTCPKESCFGSERGRCGKPLIRDFKPTDIIWKCTGAAGKY